MIKKTLSIFPLAVFSIVLSGCKTSEERLVDACVSELENELTT